jgi:two-component system response regulator FixJ
MLDVVHVVDDDPAVRSGLKMLLESGGRRCVAYGDARAFLDALAENPPAGCLVTDVRMPDMSGVELMRELKGRGVAMPVIVMTAYADVPLAIRVMREGAIDLLEKPFTNDAFLAAVDGALLDAVAQRKERDQLDAIRERLGRLTPREREVLAGLLKGAPNKIIAHELGVGIRTIETHRATVMEKMRADSLSELVRMCVLAERDAPPGPR